MAPPIRSRIAPAALLVAFAFVVVGFLRADREMVRAEADRADLTASETATLIEVFLLRHLVQLHSASRLATLAPIRGQDSRTSFELSSSDSSILIATFATIWTTDSAGYPRRRISLVGAASDSAFNNTPLETAITTLIQSRSADDHAASRPNVFIVREAQGAQLVFVSPNIIGHSTDLLVGVTPLDSLRAWLLESPRTASFDIVVRSQHDTIVSLPSSSRSLNSHVIERAIATPFATPWTLVMSYSPSGRGVRIALWIVGLGAIVGLGIGLLLERREASRIADRSSELEHLSAELLRANRAKSEFLANVSHELRTPLNAIVGFVDLLRDGVYGALNARQVGPVERIEASANHLRHLVDQILDLAKMAAGRLEVHAEPIELRPFVFDVASEVEPLITEKGLSFSLAVGATLPRVRTDPTHLRQILINLLGNAVKFTNAGTVSVRGKLLGVEDRATTPIPSRFGIVAPHIKPPRPGGVWIALQVVDSGVGIPQKDCERIFDEFEQVNAGPRGDSMRRGTGLGLSISRRLARLLGGDITVESELGRGSIFTLWLPVDPADLRGDQAA
jgi:signal transduction histidine kinase